MNYQNINNDIIPPNIAKTTNPSTNTLILK